MEKLQINNWRLAFMQNSEYMNSDFEPSTIKEIKKQKLEILEASVPGNFELDFIKAKKLPEDIYFGTNILEVQKLESMHLWYFTEFDLEDNNKDALLKYFGDAKEYRDSLFIPGNKIKDEFFEIYVDIPDEAGVIAIVASLLASQNISIKNIGIVHNREFEEGALSIEFYTGEQADRAAAVLRQHRYRVWET